MIALVKNRRPRSGRKRRSLATKDPRRPRALRGCRLLRARREDGEGGSRDQAPLNPRLPAASTLAQPSGQKLGPAPIAPYLRCRQITGYGMSQFRRYLQRGLATNLRHALPTRPAAGGKTRGPVADRPATPDPDYSAVPLAPRVTDSDAAQPPSTRSRGSGTASTPAPPVVAKVIRYHLTFKVNARRLALSGRPRGLN